jgi:DNA processing protein
MTTPPVVSAELAPGAYAAALACLPAVGPAWLVEALGRYAPEVAWELVCSGRLWPATRARGLPGGPAWADKARQFDVGALWEHCRQHEIAVTWPGAAGYPGSLRSGPSPAGVLFWCGDLGLVDERPSVAVIGTRRCTPEGREVAYQLGYDLSAAGVCVVSGLALGIDGAAHAGALAAARDRGAGDGASFAGSTVGVAASGVDVAYPPQHTALWAEVARLGAIVSETPPGSPAQSWRFPTRNRIIAGLARMVVVVECHASGGSWHTVEAALKRGSEVGAVPGSVQSAASVGTNTLLHEGATPVRSAQDVLDALGVLERPRQGTPPSSRGPSRRPVAGDEPADRAAPAARAEQGRRAAPGVSSVAPGPREALDALEAKVLGALAGRPLCLDEIVERSGLPVTAVVVALERLENLGTLHGEAGWWARSTVRPHR